MGLKDNVWNLNYIHGSLSINGIVRLYLWSRFPGWLQIDHVFSCFDHICSSNSSSHITAHTVGDQMFAGCSSWQGWEAPVVLDEEESTPEPKECQYLAFGHLEVTRTNGAVQTQ